MPEFKLTCGEIELSSKEKAVESYKFMCRDLEEGLVYGVNLESANKNMEAIGSSFRFTKALNSREFCEKFYKEYKK